MKTQPATGETYPKSDLFNKAASQLNAFAISLTVKSALAFLILIIYFGPILAERVMPLSFFPEQLQLYIEK
ncbi:type III secretion system protein [Escherichia coli]|uniref:type III secretion system protein n=1 Tax=Escherichia coli TaxID=562 RepID=UPI001625CBBA|nr:type III secretion system protein [Escherichia coli]